MEDETSQENKEEGKAYEEWVSRELNLFASRLSLL
jgi:hypothetical protein